MKKILENHLANQLIDEWKEIADITIRDAKPREVPLEFSNTGAIALIGVRRSGKTSIALLEAKKISENNFFYMNFEDPRYIEYNDYKVFDVLIDVYVEKYQFYPKVIVFDEIQNIEGWERWVRKFVDSKKTKLIITGSSAKLLSSELSTAVAGRVLEYKIWPLNFNEFIQFKKTVSEQDKKSYLPEYLKFGGFPEVVMTREPIIKQKVLHQYFSDIVIKDVMNRKGIRDKSTLDKIIYHYLTNISCHHSFSALKKAYELGGSTPQNYTQFLQDAFLIFEVARYHRNLKVQSRDTKKIYSIDVGLRNFNSKSLTEDAGKLLENVIYLHLIRTGKEIYYFKEEMETDFVIVENHQPVAAIQVTDSDLDNPDTYSREVDGLIECLNFTKLKFGTIITKNRKERIKYRDVVIELIPAVDWLHIN